MDDYFYDYEEDVLEESEPSDGLNLLQLWEFCIKSSIIQISVYMGTFLLWNFIFRLTTQTVKICHELKQVICIISGGIILFTTIGFGSIYLVIYGAVTYLLLILMKYLKLTNLGYILGVYCISILLICEFLENNKVLWHQIRGIQMIASMKLISLGFDMDVKKIKQLPSALNFTGYVLCPGNCVLGPWTSYNDFMEIFNIKEKTWTLKIIYKIILNSVISIVFLVLSNCVVSFLIPDNSWLWFKAYRDALSFRCSHYFISFLSQTVMITAGFNTETEITKPFLIEFPRSLVEVVIAWNIPMHNWLKMYIFKNMKRFGIFPAIFTTYIVSALLHGLNFQLSAVLLSLGFYTFVEFKLRKKLSVIFNSCVASSSCKPNCSHKFKKRNSWVLLFNINFSILSIVHLIYLGVMFESSTSESYEEGFSYLNVIEKWSSLNFLSHWVIAICYVFYIVI